MKNDFLIAITQLCAEKNLSKEVVLSAIEAALISAYKRNFGAAQSQAVSVTILPNSGDVKVFAEKTVVEEVTDPRAEILVSQARKLKATVQVGETVEVESTPHDFGRIAAQTAKQVVLQRLREAERDAVYAEFNDKERDIVSGVVQRVEPKRLIVDLGKVEAYLPEEEQVPTEHYRAGQRVKALLVEVRRGPRGPEVRLSRTHKDLLRRLFELEVPEIYQGTVEIKSIAREPGSRSKVAVAARQEGIDPVGSCVGMRGIRIQNIVRELNDEKIDVVQWHPDPVVFVGHALSPAQVVQVEVVEAEKNATVIVPDRQLSLAIGKEGQNARLAAKLTGWRIDIKSSSAAKLERAEREARRQVEGAAAREAALAAAAAAPVSEPATPVPAVEPVTEPTIVEVPEAAAPHPIPEAAAETLVAAEQLEPPTAIEPPAAEVEPPSPVTPAEVLAPSVETPPPSGVTPVVIPDSWKLLPEEIEPEYEVGGHQIQTPEQTGPGQIRFAEDLFGEGGYRLDGKKKKGRRGTEEKDRADAAKAKKPARRGPTPVQPPEEEEETNQFEAFVRRPAGRR